MASENKILKLMIAHHALLEALLAFFRDSLNDTDKATRIFNDFKWQLEKHFFAEEKINFTPAIYAHSGLGEIIKKLVDEHAQMTRMAGTIEMQLERGESANMGIEGFSDLLKKHRDTEEQALYPHFSEVLSDQEQDAMIKRINDITLEKL